jgi:hypothetical protein
MERNEEKNGSKLDALLMLFSSLKNNDNKETSNKKQKREVLNDSIDNMQQNEKRNMSMILNLENIPFINALGWVSGKGNTAHGIEMEIHDSQYMVDTSFENVRDMDIINTKEAGNIKSKQL